MFNKIMIKASKLSLCYYYQFYSPLLVLLLFLFVVVVVGSDVMLVCVYVCVLTGFSSQSS